MSINIKIEKSCGAVIYKLIDNIIYFLILEMGYGHFSHCKGHVEIYDNSEADTALREIKEETSLEVELDTNFREVITYSPAPGIIKDVVFFIAKSISDFIPIDDHDNEVKNFYREKYEDALSLITYDLDKNVLIKANNYLKGILVNK